MFTESKVMCSFRKKSNIDIEKNFFPDPFSRKVSVGECRRVSLSFQKIVCDLSCRPVVASASWLSLKKCRS